MGTDQLTSEKAFLSTCTSLCNCRSQKPACNWPNWWSMNQDYKLRCWCRAVNCHCGTSRRYLGMPAWGVRRKTSLAMRRSLQSIANRHQHLLLLGSSRDNNQKYSIPLLGCRCLMRYRMRHYSYCMHWAATVAGSTATMQAAGQLHSVVLHSKRELQYILWVGQSQLLLDDSCHKCPQ